MCIEKLPFNTWTPLNPSDPNYLLFVKSLVFIRQMRADHAHNFELEFNSEGRPFQKIKKIFFQKIVTRTNNNTILAALSLKPENSNMAKKVTTPAVQILLPETVNASYLAAKNEMSERIAEAAEIVEVNTPALAKKAASIVKVLKTIKTSVENVRKAQKAPYKDACDLIDGAAKNLTEEADPQIKRLSEAVIAFDAAEAKKKALADEEAAKLRQIENQKVIDAQFVLDQARKSIVDFEDFAAGVIVNETDRNALLTFWKATLKPFDPMTYAEVLQPDATAMKERLVELGKAKDAMLLAAIGLSGVVDPDVLAKATEGWESEKAKYAHLASVAVAKIDEKVNENLEHVALNAETAKSQITATQIANVPEKNLATRSTWDYEVTDITLVPPQFTMTVINDVAVKETMKLFKEQIANGASYPGLRFFEKVTPSGR